MLICIISGAFSIFIKYSILLHRAIPEAGYITLGTIRYGVKLSQGCFSTRCTHFRSSSLSMAEHISNNNYSSINSPANMQLMSSEHDTIPRSINGNRQNAENISEICSSSMPNVCDSDNSLSDVTSVNGSCCLNTTKCTLPWTNKADNVRSMDLCKFLK